MEKPIIHYIPDYLIEPPHPVTINLIGCGGTGSLIAVRLARLDQALRQLDHPGLHLTIYDGDVVESHNVGRQNFTINDVGQYKASCVVEKINLAFGLQWDAINQYLFDAVPKGNIIITAVDDAKFRVSLSENLKIGRADRDHDKIFYWLDTGNGKDFGQVVLGTVGDASRKWESTNVVRVDNLPTVADMFNLEASDVEEVQGMASCSFAESIMQQDLFINDAVSVQAVNLLWKLLRDYKISYHGVIINQATLQQRGIPIKA